MRSDRGHVWDGRKLDSTYLGWARARNENVQGMERGRKACELEWRKEEDGRTKRMRALSSLQSGSEAHRTVSSRDVNEICMWKGRERMLAWMG